MAHSARKEKNPTRTNCDLPILRTMLPSPSTSNTTTPFSNIANFHDHLQVAMNAYLRSAVVKAIEKSSKKKKVENLADLKTKLLSNERVRGLLTIVDETIGDKPGVSQSFMQKHNNKVADCWRPFVNDHFADIVALVDSPINKLISDEDDEDDEVKDDEDAKKDKEVIRTISVPIKKVLKNDLSEEFVEFFYQKMNKTQVLATNLFQDLAAATTAIALWVPTIEPNSSSDNALQEIIPIAFREHVTMQLCHAIKWDELLKNASLTLETREMFSFSHVQMIASANFASRGLRQHTAEKFPLWQKGNATVRAFNFGPSGLSPAVMSDVCTKPATNIKTMWKGYKKRNKALDNILEILLCLH